ncbi:MAG TPA: hypothetical protein VII61_18630 [Ktedonobacteraceae bacterium]|jgi:hypothetical protein
MQNSYIHNSFIFVGNTSQSREYSATIHFNPVLVAGYAATDDQNTPSQKVPSEGFSGLYNNDEYMGSTSPYDDDGY